MIVEVLVNPPFVVSLSNHERRMFSISVLLNEPFDRLRANGGINQHFPRFKYLALSEL